MAPVLSNIFLAKMDRDIKHKSAGLVLKICRYVDDFLVLSFQPDAQRAVVDTLKVFKESSTGLKFTIEVPTDGKLQFLDLLLSIQAGHICWSYHPRAKKGLLHYSSKNVAGRYNVPVVFSAPLKLAGICSQVRSRVKGKGKRKNECTIKHTAPFVPCGVGVVYRLPVSCGDVYIGQTGRCINQRIRFIVHHCSGAPRFFSGTETN